MGTNTGSIIQKDIETLTITKMTTTLDQATRNALNQLSERSKSETTFNHEILLYGVDAVAHYHLMKKAQEFMLLDTPLN